MSLSVCIIARNEQEVISRCLDSITFADEIVVVDTGSTDRTQEIAARYGKVFDFEWQDDFSAARNFAFSKATGDYIMWCDCDDVVPEESQKAIGELKLQLSVDVSNISRCAPDAQRKKPLVDAYYLPYHVAFDEQGSCTLQYYRERIVRRSCGFRWKEPVHEYLEVSGNVEYLDIPIEHRPGPKESSDRNLNIYRKHEFSTRALYYYARELKDHQLYDEAIQKYHDFLSRPDGWVEDKIGACIGLSECFMAKGEGENALSALTHSFVYDTPRPEVCCRIGNVWLDRQEYGWAAYWYHATLNAPEPSAGFVYKDYLGYIPSIQLCVCYSKMGDMEKAVFYNECAGKIKPKDESYLYNKSYFSRTTDT